MLRKVPGRNAGKQGSVFVACDGAWSCAAGTEYFLVVVLLWCCGIVVLYGWTQQRSVPLLGLARTRTHAVGTLLGRQQGGHAR